MFDTRDDTLSNLKPSSLPWDEFERDCELMINEGAFHSDEVSESDEELAKKEIDMNIRPINKQPTDKHVIHVYDKPWRSSRVSDIKICF